MTTNKNPHHVPREKNATFAIAGENVALCPSRKEDE